MVLPTLPKPEDPWGSGGHSTRPQVLAGAIPHPSSFLPGVPFTHSQLGFVAYLLLGAADGFTAIE